MAYLSPLLMAGIKSLLAIFWRELYKMQRTESTTASTYHLQTIKQIKELIKVWNDTFDVLRKVNKRNGVTPDTTSPLK